MKAKTNVIVQDQDGNSSKPLLVAGFYITDFCKCKCGEDVSPSQVDTINQILYNDNRDKVIGFECWKCGDWISFPKTCH